jgi:hypothetical protein
VHRQAGVDDGVDEKHVAALDLGVEVLQEPDALVVLPVPGELDEVERVVDGRRPREVADEGDARLERSDEERLLPLVVTRQLGRDLADAGGDLVGVEEDLADALVACRQGAQDAFLSPKRAARRSKSRS